MLFLQIAALVSGVLAIPFTQPDTATNITLKGTNFLSQEEIRTIKAKLIANHETSTEKRIIKFVRQSENLYEDWVQGYTTTSSGSEHFATCAGKGPFLGVGQDGATVIDYYFQQADGNVVAYGPNGPVWDSGVTGACATACDCLLIFQTDGNLVAVCTVNRRILF